MKIKIFLLLLLAAIGTGVATWYHVDHQPVAAATDASGRKALYYTCSMHPWVRESKPGPCPVCGMTLTPVYAPEPGQTANTNADSSLVTLEPESISTIHVQTDTAEIRPVRRTLHLAGQITGNSTQVAWFEFAVYQRDLAWLKLHQTLEVTVSGSDDTYTAEIKPHGIKSFADTDFDMMSGSTTVRAQISNPPVKVAGFGEYRLFNGLHADAHLIAETDPVLTIPRSAVISRGTGPLVYVDVGDGHYSPRTVELGRIGNDWCEVRSGLKAGDKVVTNGNVLIDSEAQLTAGR